MILVRFILFSTGPNQEIYKLQKINFNMKEQILIKETNFEKARKKIKENKDSEIIFSSDDDELNRKILEKEKIKILLLNQKDRKDFQKQRNSTDAA